jgi:hypothetical protein
MVSRYVGAHPQIALGKWIGVLVDRIDDQQVFTQTVSAGLRLQVRNAASALVRSELCAPIRAGSFQSTTSAKPMRIKLYQAGAEITARDIEYRYSCKTGVA